MVITTYQAIADITPYIKKEFHVFLFEKIKAKSIYEYDERYLKFLKDFTIKAQEAEYKSGKNIEEFALPI